MHPAPIRYRLLLQWLLLAGTLGLVLFAAWRSGMLARLIDADPTRISLGIALVFALASAHAAYCVFRLAREIDHAEQLREALDGAPAGRLHLTPGSAPRLDEQPLPAGLASTHAARVSTQPAGRGREIMLAALERRLRGSFETGWLVADLMFKLGLLGTVVGFILMLGAVATSGDLDFGAMRAMLTGMSEGMRVALHTTLAGLIGGMLLGLQYHLVDRAADELISIISETVELSVVPRVTGD